LDNGKLLLEAFDYQAQVDEGLRAVAEWLAEHALPAAPEYNYFREKLKSDLVLLPDEDFNHFVRNATVVEPHVRIDDVSGTADDGGLFYTENLPPESLLLSLVMATVERRKKGANGNGLMSAEEVLAKAVGGWEVDGEGRVGGLCDALLQVGGDATTGRGLVAFHFAGGESHDE
jgi:CRISPR-associated protein Cmr4